MGHLSRECDIFILDLFGVFLILGSNSCAVWIILMCLLGQ